MITETMGIRISTIAPKADAWRSELVTMQMGGLDILGMFNILIQENTKVDSSVLRAFGDNLRSVPVTQDKRDFVLLNGRKLFFPEDSRPRNFMNVTSRRQGLGLVSCENPVFALRWAHHLKDNLLHLGDLTTAVMHPHLYDGKQRKICLVKRFIRNVDVEIEVSLMSADDQKANLSDDLHFLYQIPGPYYPRGLKVA